MRYCKRSHFCVSLPRESFSPHLCAVRDGHAGGGNYLDPVTGHPCRAGRLRRQPWYFAAFSCLPALGNLLAARIIPRIRRPLRSYGFAECGYAGLALLSLPLLATFGPMLGGGQSLWHWTLLATLSIGPASLVQGLCFPLLSHAFITQSEHRCAQGGGLYTANLLGAASGCFLGGITLPSYFGFHTSLILFCAISLLLGMVAILISRRFPATTPTASAAKTPSSRLPLLPVIALTASGILSIAFEVIVFAWFRQITTSSLQASMAVLLAFILGLGAGSLVATQLRKRPHRIQKLPIWCLLASGLILSCYPAIFRYFQSQPLVNPATDILWRSVELALKSTLILLPACLSIGTLFPLFWDLLPQQKHGQGRAIGLATFFNKLGCAFGAWVACFMLMPQLGLSWSVFLCGLLYLLLAFILDTSRSLKLYPAVLGGWLLICLVTPTQPILAPGHTLIASATGFGNVVKVTESESSRHITLNENYVLNGTAAALPWQQQESWIPLLLTPSPQRVCFIGMASGIGANAALDLPIQQLDSIELIPQVRYAAEHYFSTWNQRLFSDPRATVHVDDGRHFLQSSTTKFDTIICTLFLPSREGSSHLYSADFFQTVLNSLAGDGRFCLWLPLYQMDAEISDCIITTFQQAFPYAIVVRGNLSPQQPVIGLMGSKSPFDLQRFVSPATPGGFFRCRNQRQIAILPRPSSCPVVVDGRFKIRALFCYQPPDQQRQPSVYCLPWRQMDS